MAEPSTELESAATANGLTEDRWLGGRLTLVQPKRGHRVGTDAALLVAAAGDARQGRIVDVGAGVGAVGLALAQRNRACVRRSCRDRSRAGAARREQRGAQRASGAHARLAARRAQFQRSAARRGSLNRPIASSPTRRSSTPGRFASLPDEGKARAHVLAGAEAGATPRGLDSGFAGDARAGGAVRDDPPARRAERDPRGDRRPARRARGSARSSDARRERASFACLGREGVQGAAAARAGARPARRRRPPDAGSGRASIAASGSSTGAGSLVSSIKTLSSSRAQAKRSRRT